MTSDLPPASRSGHAFWRFSELLDSRDAKQMEIAAMKGRAADLGAQITVKASLWRKIKAFLLQISFLKAKERDLLSEIMAVENKHHFLRKKKKLRRFSPTWSPREEDIPRPREKRKNDFWLWFAIGMLFFWRDNKPKDSQPPQPR
jgi:hypothetical protein